MSAGSLTSAQAGRRGAAHAAMLGYAALIAGSFSFGDIAAPHLDPAVLNAVRFVAATVLIAGIYYARPGVPRRLPGGLWRFLLLGGLMAAYFILMFVALRITDPISTGAVFTLIPIMTAMLGLLILGQHVRRLVWLSLVISGAGALWVIFDADLDRLLAFEIGAGEAYFFVGCLCQALYAPLVRKLNRGENIVEFSVWTIAGCTLCLLVVALPQLPGTDWTGLGWAVWLSIAYLAIGSTAASFVLLQYGSLNLPAAKVFPYTYLVPSMVILLEAALGNGWVAPGVAAGAAVTVIGLVILVATPDARAAGTTAEAGPPPR